MANIKKYNPDSQNWETWASNSATGVYSDNPNLLSEQEETITVEDALIRDREDIEMMKKNISWLALHGGRGGGGGGGSSEDVQSNIEIYDSDGNLSTDIVWRSTSNSVYYIITSSKASNKFSITATLDGKVIDSQKGIATNTRRQIKIGTLKKTDNNKHTLRISAVDLYDNLVSTTITITELSLSVSKTAPEYTVDVNEIFSNSLLSVNCKSSVPGNYILYWGTSSDIDINPESRRGEIQLFISAPIDYTVSIPYWTDNERTRLLVNQNVSVGQTLTFYFVLVSANTESMKSDVEEIWSTITSPSDLAIRPVSLSPNINEVTKLSKNGILNCNFIAYLNTNNFTYDYTVTVSKIEFNSSTGIWDVVDTYPNMFYSGSGTYKNMTSIMYNTLHRDDFFEGGCTYKFDIYAEDRMDRSKHGSISTYVEIQAISETTIDLGNIVDESTIFDFNIRDNIPSQSWVWPYQNNNYRLGLSSKTISTTADLFNMGGKSRVETTHCRLTNKAYMVINKSTADGEPISWFPSSASSVESGLISAASPQFTLSVRFYNDFTPDDNRTIFNFGNYIPMSPTNPNARGKGILINNHDYYIKLGNNSNLVTGKIQDSIFHEIDIVFGRNNSKSAGNTTVEVYHNGVLLSLGTEIRIEDIFDLNFDEMSLACFKTGNNISQYTNIKLQGVSLYSTAFSPYQIVCNYINHIIVWDLNNGELNVPLLNEKLASNLILRTNEDTYECPIWREEFRSFDIDNWIENNLGILTPRQDLWDVCPIPIVIINFENATSWQWDAFSTSWENGSLQDVTVPMYFFKPYGTGKVFENVLVKVSGQGTTSKRYAIKNLNIDFGENRLFWAKQNWFPERIYTLKADIVDSAHVNNACIGKFINTCAQNTNLLEPTPPMQYFNTNKNSSVFEDLPTAALDENNGVSIKHTLEGFPVLLLARFPEQDGSATNRSLGIYSFNLGREAYYNMGFEVLKRFRDENGEVASKDTSAPTLLGRPNTADDVITFDAESWEGIDSFNCSPKTTNTESEINAQTNNNYNSSINAVAPVQLDGYFWSSYTNHIKHFWDIKYPEGGTSIDRFQKLCEDLVQSPYTKGDYDTGDRGEVYEYDWDGTKMIVPDQTHGGHQIQRLNKSCPFNVKNAVFYYVVCMLFGLVDSLGKNLNMRIWNKSDSNSVWYTCFYDMDTALGIDNIGTEKVQPDVCDEVLKNSPELTRSFALVSPSTPLDNRTMYTVKDNKLWGIIDHPIFKDQFVGNAVEGTDSQYALAWNIIRTNYLRSADDFMNLYFNNQTQGVGELLYNQDFDVKYISTPESSFMYGDRKAFVKDWITKRIKFLDSYFGYLQKVKGGRNTYLESTVIEDCSYKNKICITHQSGTEYLPIVSNTPCIITSTVGGERNAYYYYLPANTPVNVKMINSLGTPGIQTVLNNSDLLLEIRNLSDLAVSKIDTLYVKQVPNTSTGDALYTQQIGALSSFTKFDISSNTSFDNDGIDFIKLFKTWNNGDNTLPYTLTELNLSNTRSNTVTRFPLNLTSGRSGPNGETYYQNPFENLTDIDIRNSCVTDVMLPQNIALHTLQIAGSPITHVELYGQSVLKSIDFSGCTALNTITLEDCSAFETITLRGLPDLRNLRINRCSALSELLIDMDGYDNEITVQIDDVPNLKKISILNVHNPESQISLIAEGLENLSLSGCRFSEVVLSSASKHTLKSVDISRSSINTINWDGTFTGDYLDLEDCPYLVQGGINITNNTAITKIQLPNIEGEPVNLNFEFTGCTNLERIYGNLNINKASQFENCTKFKIHNGNFGGRNTVSNAGKQFYLADEAITDVCLKDEFQVGPQVTNLTINVASATNIFRNTAIDAFDVYYVLRHLSSKVRSISGMFRECTNLKMNCISTSIDNSPHWTMFSHPNCANITSISNLFYDSGITSFRLYGNHLADGGHQGLFTPLVNCSNFSAVFGSGVNGTKSFIADKNTFKLSDSVFFGGNITVSFSNFQPTNVYDDVNSLTITQTYNATHGNSSHTSLNGVARGNIKDFFSGFYQLPSSLSHIFNGLEYLRYGTSSNSNEDSDTMCRLPLEVTSLSNCFNASSTNGYIFLQRLFTPNINDEYEVTSLSNCFDGSTGATWYLDNSTLRGFTRLNTFNSCMSGTKKEVRGIEFPYDIFDPCCTRITNLTSFFYGARPGNIPGSIDLPGRLFKKCTNLQNISSCFNSFAIPFKLTPNGFDNCKYLTNVTSLFANISSSYIQSCIPNNFFNLGFNEVNVDIIGAGLNQDTITLPQNAVITESTLDYIVTTTNGNQVIKDYYRNVEVDTENKIITYYPTSTYCEQISEDTGNGLTIVSVSEYGPIPQATNWNSTTIHVTKRLPVRHISNMSTLFFNTVFPAYEHELILEPYITQGDIEPNPDYCPFDYIYENGTWIRANRDEKELTFMWAFDGEWTQELKEMDLSNYVLDDEIPTDVKNTNSSQTINFGCPPDLLRWCTNNPNLTSLFENSGFYGRIPAYLLKAVPELTSTDHMFSNCSNISAYKTETSDNKYRTIPPNFFKYVPNLTDLSSMFSHTVMYCNPVYDGKSVFDVLKKALNISSIFYATRWSGGSSSSKFELNSVFATNKISNARSAFNGSYSEGTRNQYIRFVNMFSRDKSKHPASADYYVFYGYISDNYVEHESTKTCSELTDRKNYAFYNQ